MWRLIQYPPMLTKTTARDRKKSAMAGQMALKLTPNAQIVLKKRYLIKDDTGQPTEDPEELFQEGGSGYSAARRPIRGAG